MRLNGGQWSAVKWKGEEENEMERNKFVGREKEWSGGKCNRVEGSEQKWR